MKYLRAPRQITLADLKDKDASWSAGMYRTVEIPNSRKRPVRELIAGGYDKGSDPGSIYYLNKSTYYFIRTKALQTNSYLIASKGGAIAPLNPRVFEDMSLTDGDILLSKDSNVGECAMVDGDGWRNHTLSGGVVRLRASINRHYLFAFLKDEPLRAELLSMAPRGAAIAHANELWLDCHIPFPAQPHADDAIAYVAALTEAIIDKEKAIRARNDEIDARIEGELTGNQMGEAFHYKHPTLDELRSTGRLDAAIYSEAFKREEHRIKSYANGWANYEQLGFDIGRGQNLQLSCIGQSIYSDVRKPNFYRLVAPTDISEYRTVEAFRYRGNKRELDLVKKGDVIFGAEGFCKGRCVILVDEQQRTISNIHGVIFHPRDGSMTRGIFLGCFLGYLRKVGIVDAVGAGGSGGSLAIGYLDQVPIPRFPDDTQRRIARLYHNPVPTPVRKATLGDLVDWRREWNDGLGIWELDCHLKTLQRTLFDVQEEIIEGRTVSVPF
jgi:hypothetical protein